MNHSADIPAPHNGPACPLAIIGIGCLFPKAADKTAYWANIKQRVDAISEVPETHWRLADYYDADPKAPDKTYGRRGGFLDAIDFNPLEFSIQPNILEAIDSSQLLGLVAAREALRDAGYDPASDFARERVSVLLGVTGALEMVIPLGARLGHPQWRRALLDSGVPAAVADEVIERIAASYVPWQENSFPGLLGNVVAGRISKQFDLGGSNSVVDAACGSSLSAVHMAAMELACHRADMVITGGIDTFNDIFMYSCFSKTPALSPSNRVCPFDASSDGTLIGEGLGLVVLKRLADAERDGDAIYAVIRGVGSASDGKGGAIYEPSAKGQVRTLRDAHAQAGVTPRSIGLIEAHGTGTRVGDATEIRALREVFGDSDGRPWCALGSVKSQIGHTKAAAGAAGLIKAALALRWRVLPPTLNVQEPQAVIGEGNSPFYVNTELRPWLHSGPTPRRAGVSAFGFGGSNFHCVLEEYGQNPPACDWAGAPQILAFSAADDNALRQQLSACRAQLANSDAGALRRFAARSRAAYAADAAARLLCVVEQADQLTSQLDAAERLIAAPAEVAGTPTGVWYSRGTRPAPQLAVLFPGQGAQYPFMLRDLACHAPELLDQLQLADATLGETEAEPLSARLYPHSRYSTADQAAAAQRLQATAVAQPAIGCVSLGAWHYLQRFGLQAQGFAGHSYGELTALCAAGSYSAAELYRLSQLRGQLMAGTAGDDRGTMLAVTAPLEQIDALLREEALDLVLANRNTPNQGVLSGRRSEIERAAKLCQQRGLRATPLEVAAAFHSPLVAEASVPFRAALDETVLLPPTLPVYANSTATLYPAGPTAEGDEVRDLLAQQIARPVEFVRQIQRMADDGFNLFVEIGPGARLTGMVGKILADRPVQAIALDSSAGKRLGLVDVARLLAQLCALGVPLQLQPWDAEFAATAVATAEPAPPRLTVRLCGANYHREQTPRPPSDRQLVDARNLPQVQVAPAPVASATPASLPLAATPAAQPAPQHDNLLLLQRMQEDTARLHEQFLAGQASALQALQALLGLQAPAATPPATSPATSPAIPATVAQPAISAAPCCAPAAPVPAAPVATVPSPAAASAPPSPPAAPVSTAVAAGALEQALLAVVADKTGYPVDMLELDMRLDADLGIDSIKRVEILSALQEQLPQLPAVAPDELG
ncbi:type I polyketide synthase, partial [Desulfuromonas thiophila]